MRISYWSSDVCSSDLSLGWEPLIEFMAFISINLGFINLLPVLMLDGGHLLFYASEAVRRRPVKAKAQELAFLSGLALLVSLIDRQSVVWGKSVSVRVDLGGRRTDKKTQT